jgi:hypothetical protein
MDRKHSVSALRNIVRTTRSLDLLDKLAPSIDAAAARHQALVRRLLIKDLLLKLSQGDGRSRTKPHFDRTRPGQR